MFLNKLSHVHEQKYNWIFFVLLLNVLGALELTTQNGYRNFSIKWAHEAKKQRKQFDSIEYKR